MASKIEWGQKVKPTKLAIKNGVLAESDWGIFLGQNRIALDRVFVAKAGTRVPCYYSVDFWEVDYGK